MTSRCRTRYRTSRRVFAWAIALTCVTSSAPRLANARATSAPLPLTIAIFVPNSAFGGPYVQAAYGKSLAAQLGTALGRPFRSLIFGAPAALEAALRRGRIALAVLDPVYFVARRRRLKLSAPLAIATHRGKSLRRWAMYVRRDRAARASLAGKRLAYAASGGADRAFLENGLLAGVVTLRRFFSAARIVRTVGNALSAVKFGQADCALAPVGDTSHKGHYQGLRQVFEVGTVPNPVLVQVDRALPAALVATIMRAIQSLPVQSRAAKFALDGWRRIDSVLARALATIVAPKAPRPRLAESAPLVLPLGRVVKLTRQPLVLPGLTDYFSGDD